MPRKARVYLPGGVYHLTARGNNKQTIFFEPVDYLFFLDCLKESKKKHQFTLFLYVLMPNHFHLLLQTSKTDIENSVSKIMHCLTTKYSNYANRRNGRIGHLFQGRFYSELLENDSHFLELTRYIHLNPVRAGLVSRPGDYPYSSYRNYLSEKQEGEKLVDTDEVLRWFEKKFQTQRKRYQLFVEEGKKVWELKLKKPNLV